MKTIRWCTLLLSLVMLLGAFAACGGQEPAVTDPDPTGDATNPPETNGDNGGGGNLTEEELYRPDATDYGGYEFTLLTTSNGSDPYLYYYEENKPSGDVISNALYKRQQLLLDEYGIVMRLNVDNVDNCLGNLRRVHATGDYLCDISLIPAKQTFKLVVEGIYANLNDYGNQINFEASYWDQRIQSEYLINDMLFTLEGDYTFQDELTTLTIVYNQSVYDRYGYTETYGTPYSMVESHEWTYETMMGMIKDLATDSNSDGTMNENDTWGMVSEITATYYFLLGAGLKPLANNNGEFILQFEDSSFYTQMYDIIEETMSMVRNPDILMANGNGTMSTTDIWTAASNIFEYDRTLFRSTTLSAVTLLKNMESDYGILPIPAFYNDQTEYYCWVSGNTHCPLAIPRAGVDVAKTAGIIELFCYHSRYGSDTVYSAFFDHLTYARLCKSPEDIQMLNVIFASKTYDIDQALEVTSVESSMYSIGKNNTLDVLFSTISGLVDTAEFKLNELLIQLNANN